MITLMCVCLSKCYSDMPSDTDPTLISLFPLINFCRLGREPTTPSGTEGNCSSDCRDFRCFTERFTWRGLAVGSRCSGKGRASMYIPGDKEEKLREGGGRRLV